MSELSTLTLLECQAKRRNNPVDGVQTESIERHSDALKGMLKSVVTL